MNCALQGHRQLHMELGRLGSYQGYDITPFPPRGGGDLPGLSGSLPFASLTMVYFTRVHKDYLISYLYFISILGVFRKKQELEN